MPVTRTSACTCTSCKLFSLLLPRHFPIVDFLFLAQQLFEHSVTKIANVHSVSGRILTGPGSACWRSGCLTWDTRLTGPRQRKTQIIYTTINGGRVGTIMVGKGQSGRWLPKVTGSRKKVVQKRKETGSRKSDKAETNTFKGALLSVNTQIVKYSLPNCNGILYSPLTGMYFRTAHSDDVLSVTSA